MKIWKQFGSAHSDNLTIIGRFKNAADAAGAHPIVAELTFAAWEERHADMDAFISAWKQQEPNLPYWGLLSDEFQLGIDNPPDMEVDGEVITISQLRADNVGGIVKLLRRKGAVEITLK